MQKTIPTLVLLFGCVHAVEPEPPAPVIEISPPPPTADVFPKRATPKMQTSFQMHTHLVADCFAWTPAHDSMHIVIAAVRRDDHYEVYIPTRISDYGLLKRTILAQGQPLPGAAPGSGWLVYCPSKRQPDDSFFIPVLP